MNFRQKNALVSYIFALICVIVLTISRLQGFVLFGTIVFFGIVYYFLVYWLFNFQVYPEGFITILLLPAIIFVSYLLMVVYFIRFQGTFALVVSSLIFGVAQYYMILTQNILNRSHFDIVPISQAALIANNFFSIIGFFVTSLSIVIVPELNIYARLVIIFIMAVIYLVIFTLINKIDVANIIFSILIFALTTTSFALLFLTAAINIRTIIGVALVQSLLFRAITLVTLYGSRKVISTGDKFQLLGEAVIASIILIYMYYQSNNISL